ncbi:MAG: hypothetical protein H6711_06115 [Myxococcales bacterium]|nr:hypothetical protein [Myxococcales bacterium]
MADPAPEGELGPNDLDLLEDALADLDAPLPANASPEVALRLASFREILELTREGMPIVEVPDGILDAVLAEAERSPAIVDEPERGPGLWERLRRSFVLPGFALAATAALLVVILRPSDDLKEMSEEPASAAPAEAKDAAEDAKAEEAPSDAAAATLPEGQDPVVPAAPPGAAADEDDAEGEPAAVADEARADAQGYAPKYEKPSAIPEPKRKKSSSKKSMPVPLPGDGFDAAPEAEKIDSGDKSALRDLLAQADNDRRRGRCGEASAAYQKIVGSAGAEEAKALVGLGLCAEARGDDEAASSYFRKARSINPAIDSLISSERSKMSAPSKKASKAKSDPFE